MIAALAISDFLASGRHLFYHSLEGNPVPSDDWGIMGTRVSRQQLNLAAGTAFSFLVKAFFALAASVPYVQCLWNTAGQSNDSRAMTLSSLDTAFSVFKNFLAFVMLRL